LDPFSLRREGAPFERGGGDNSPPPPSKRDECRRSSFCQDLGEYPVSPLRRRGKAKVRDSTLTSFPFGRRATGARKGKRWRSGSTCSAESLITTCFFAEQRCEGEKREQARRGVQLRIILKGGGSGICREVFYSYRKKKGEKRTVIGREEKEKTVNLRKGETWGGKERFPFRLIFTHRRICAARCQKGKRGVLLASRRTVAT